MYSIVNELNLVQKHVGSNRVIKRQAHHHHHHHRRQRLLSLASSVVHTSSGRHVDRGTLIDRSPPPPPPPPSPPRPVIQSYPLGHFMELAPLIISNLDGVLPVLDVRIDGDRALVSRPVYYDDLHGFLKQNKRFTEVQTSFYFRQMLNIISTAHRHGIVLRDLKLKKFVFTDSSRSTLALSSLEDAVSITNRSPSLDSEGRHSDANDLFDSRYGCPAYVAPEMLQPGLYSGRSADMWSAGVILYTLLVGHYPFFDTNPQHLFQQIQSGYYNIPPTVSSLARSLICSLLSYDPQLRPSASAVLEHPWIANTSLIEDVPLFNVRIDLDQTVPTNKLLS